MIRTVSLWIRSNGKFSKPSYQDNKQTRLKPQDGEYYLRCAGKWEAVGSDPLLALDAKARNQKLLRDIERAVGPVTEARPHLKSPKEEMRLTLRAAIVTYMTTGKAAQKDWRKHTRQCYALALRQFTESCQKTYMDEIDGDDLRELKVFLRKQKTSTCKYIDPRTVYNHFLNTVSFLNTYGRKELIPQSEWPIYEEKKVVAYDPEVLAHLLQCAEAPVCRKWILHTMRKTWASFQDRIHTDFATIQTELGHSNPATTRKYLAAQDHNSPRRREQINAAAALVRGNDRMVQ